MGEIYRATDEVLGRTVAVKVLAEGYAEDPGVRERFTREALAAARLSGRPNVVTIFDVGELSGRPFIVMEYLGGGSLDDRVRAGRIRTRQALEWLEQAAAALDAAHAEGVIHRDVKPANLLLDEDGNAHVADFGIASAAGMDSLTKTGTVIGTAEYLSPEQAQGERATPASDRYAFGVVAWELLTGRRPFGGDTPAAEAAHTFTQRCPRSRHTALTCRGSSTRCSRARSQRNRRTDTRLRPTSSPTSATRYTPVRRAPPCSGRRHRPARRAGGSRSASCWSRCSEPGSSSRR